MNEKVEIRDSVIDAMHEQFVPEELAAMQEKIREGVLHLRTVINVFSQLPTTDVEDLQDFLDEAVEMDAHLTVALKGQP